jgi:hypothetical protein
VKTPACVIQWTARASAAAFLVVLVVASPAPVQAQRTATRCTPPDTTQEWYSSQRAWLDDSKHDWSSDSQRVSLLRAAGLDANTPTPVQLGWTTFESHSSGDSSAIAMLRASLRQRGAPFPTKSVVGAAGVHAVWTMILGDSLLEAAVMRRTMEAGLGEAFETETAMLEDRVRVRAGRGQLYGTLLIRRPDGSLAPARIEDSAHVDLRREAAWLPPLKQSVCAASRGRTSQ